MCSHSWNKTLVTGSAIAGSGILACLTALLGVVMPHGSTISFFVSFVLLGLAVTGVVVGFTWVCDRWERHDSARLESLLDTGKRNPKAAPTARGSQLAFDPDFSDFPELVHTPPFAGQYMNSLRGLGSTKARFGTSPLRSRTRNGQ